MMRDFAEQAVRLGREFKVNLDYSERSLEEVERLLARFREEISEADANKIEEMSKIWGGYLGEVVRRRFGDGGQFNGCIHHRSSPSAI